MSKRKSSKNHFDEEKHMNKYINGQIRQAYIDGYINAHITDGVESLDLPLDKIADIYDRWWTEDWGDLPEEDKELNRKNLKNNIIDILGSYNVEGHKIWIWAQGNFVPTIMLPSEY